MTYRRCYCFAILFVREEDALIMDTIYFERAMSEWEKANGKRCVIGIITSSELSALVLRAQELKIQDREKNDNA